MIIKEKRLINFLNVKLLKDNKFKNKMKKRFQNYWKNQNPLINLKFKIIFNNFTMTKEKKKIKINE